MRRRSSAVYSWSLLLLLRGRKGGTSRKFVHELGPKSEYRALGVHFDLVEAMGVADGDVDQPGQTRPPPPVLSHDGIIGHSLINCVHSTPKLVIVLHRRGHGELIGLSRFLSPRDAGCL